jgi:ribosome maturation factor RimP
MQITEQEITDIIEESLNDLGFDLVKVTLKGSVNKVLEILIDRLDGDKISVIDCRNASRHISAVLDVEDVISDKYFLEVSSAGVERPLIKFKDYARFIDREVTIKLKELVNARTRYNGRILKAEDNQIYLMSDGEEIVVLFDKIKKANLVLTDEMFKNLVNKNLKR